MVYHRASQCVCGGPIAMLKRAYSTLTVKSLDEDQRIIRGMATTPSPDRVGDVVEPLGVKFKNPLPLWWQHAPTKPVGTVKFGKPTKDGVPFEAQLAKGDQPGTLKEIGRASCWERGLI